MRIPVAIRLFLIIAVCLPSALFSYGIKGADLTTDAGTPVRAVGFEIGRASCRERVLKDV